MAKRRKTTGWGREVREEPIGVYRWELSGLAFWFAFGAGPFNFGLTLGGADKPLCRSNNLAEAGYLAEGFELGRAAQLAANARLAASANIAGPEKA